MSKSGLFAGLIGTAPSDGADTEKQKGYHFMQWDTGVIEEITNPLDIEGCILWLDGSDPGITTNQWDDKSGEDNHYNATTAPNMPLNVSDAMVFDGVQSEVLGNNFSTLTEAEIFCKLQLDNNPPVPATSHGIFNFRGNNSFSDNYPSVQTVPDYVGKIRCTWGSTTQWTQPLAEIADLTAYHVLDISSTTPTWILSIDQVVKATEANIVGFGVDAQSSIGRSADGSQLDGNIKQVIMYNRKLTANENTQLHNWLATK